MKHIRAVNHKAKRIQEHIEQPPIENDVVALQGPAAQRPHVPMGCAIVFSPGWEVDSSGGTAGLCQPVERDLYDCYITCYWPAQVPDHNNNYPDWTAKCRAATKSWPNGRFVIP